MAKKIAIVGRDVTLLGGVQRVISALSKSFCESGKYSVVIVSMFSSEGTMLYPLPDGVKILHLNLSRRNILIHILQYLKMTSLLSKLCKTEKIDIIMGTHCSINAFLPFVKNCKIKIGTEHNNANKSVFSMWNIMKRLFYSMLDSTVCLTQADSKNYSYLKNVNVIPNQLSFIPPRQSYLQNNVVITAGRFVKDKGFDVLIDIISEIRDECHGWQFYIFGDGEEEANLKEQVNNLKLGDIVKILPKTNNIVEEYLNASIFVLPSRQEPFGLVLTEAMACGLPVVSFDCPEGPAEIISNNIDGFLVENGNKQVFSEALLKLIRDKDLRTNFGQEAAKNVQRFHPDTIFEIWDKLFEELGKA